MHFNRIFQHLKYFIFCSRFCHMLSSTLWNISTIAHNTKDFCKFLNFSANFHQILFNSWIGGTFLCCITQPCIGIHTSFSRIIWARLLSSLCSIGHFYESLITFLGRKIRLFVVSGCQRNYIVGNHQKTRTIF